MSSAKDQVHSKFKLFAGAPGPAGSLGTLGTEIEQFAASVKAAPKSIGVEYLEHSKQLVLSLGYRDDEPGYAIKLSSVTLGKVNGFGPEQRQTLETKMAEAASKMSGIICHELFITADDEFVMVFMTRAD